MEQERTNNQRGFMWIVVSRNIIKKSKQHYNINPPNTLLHTKKCKQQKEAKSQGDLYVPIHL